MTTTDLDQLVALPDGHKEKLARDALDALGITPKRQQGDELIIACPIGSYHKDQDRNPTGALNVSKLLYNCLGCHARGTILWLIATVRGDEDTEQARQWLTGEAGLTRAMDLPVLLDLFDALYTEKTRPPMPVYSDRMLTQWERHGIPDYILKDRQIPTTTAVRLGICTDPDGYMGPPENRIRTGPRAVIPHYWQDQLVGWQSRRMPGADPTAPKYLSTPDFPRDETVFNHRPYLDEVVVVESPMSVLRHDHHSDIEATFGSEVTDRQLRHLARGRRKLIWWMDNDEAGWRAIEGHQRAGRRFRAPGAPERASGICDNWVVQNPFACDPADLSGGVYDIVLKTAVPWQIWQRPETLFCHRCLKVSHAGKC
ncbi:toprim domain-containing protein [Streptomyces sp. NPDC088752]|uniref:toprim domain-containing protein n=1 Tax=Streptomyces sp. NPDC088752 TaxID=3154963 RepID=UPI00341722F4